MLLRNVLTKTIRDLRWPTFWVAIGLAAMTAYFAILFPTYKSLFNLDELLSKMPPAARALMGATLGDASSLTGFLHIELFSMILPATAVAYTAGLASGFTAGEESRGTIDILLSYPVPRWRVVLDKYIALVTGMAVTLVVILAGTIAGAAASNSELPADRVAAALAQLGLMALAFGSFALFLSTWTGNRGTGVGMAIALLVVMYLIEALAPIIEGLKTLEPLSLFRYYMGNDPLRNGLDPANSLVLGGVAVAFLVASLVAFERRDLSA